MNSLNAAGYFMDYCNRNNGIDPEITQERFDQGTVLILHSDSSRFSWCKNLDDVLKEIHWPDIY